MDMLMGGLYAWDSKKWVGSRWFRVRKVFQKTCSATICTTAGGKGHRCSWLREVSQAGLSHQSRVVRHWLAWRPRPVFTAKPACRANYSVWDLEMGHVNTLRESFFDVHVWVQYWETYGKVHARGESRGGRGPVYNASNKWIRGHQRITRNSSSYMGTTFSLCYILYSCLGARLGQAVSSCWNASSNPMGMQ